ncbi:MAG: hypothetical protein WBB99_00720, partial [Rhodococcus sp. (in: high G+C Gram-positive bacteria)]
DWVAPKSILSASVAEHYAKMAQSRSIAVYFVGKGLVLVFGVVAMAALLWSFEERTNPALAVVPVVLALPAFFGWALDRRAGQHERLVADYADRARELSVERVDASVGCERRSDVVPDNAELVPHT